MDEMTLQEFLTATAAVPTLVLRQAMVAALAAESARTRGARHRFYARVMREVRPAMALPIPATST